MTVDQINSMAAEFFPGYLGIKAVDIRNNTVVGEMQVNRNHLAPNRYLHAGCVVTFADSLAGFSTQMNLPERAISFTTIELKSNFVRTIQEGVIQGHCEAEHLGKKTQIWRVTVSAKETGKKMAIFTCTQMILYP
ncbi:MAG: PaaI family thioesterase [Bacteroidota bacterium]